MRISVDHVSQASVKEIISEVLKESRAKESQNTLTNSEKIFEIRY